MSLSARLRAETSAAHRAAEDTSMVRAILAGTVDLSDYCRMMVNLYAIYQELELQLQLNAANASIRHVANPHLARADAIERDLDQLLGDAWRTTGERAAATGNYLNRLRAIGREHPERLVAHAYVRYMGDLSGGQIISRALRPVLGPKADHALHFYHFGSKAEMDELKARFRDGLDRIGCERKAQADPIVKEALLAFDAARQLLDELAIPLALGSHRLASATNAARTS